MRRRDDTHRKSSSGRFAQRIGEWALIVFVAVIVYHGQEHGGWPFQVILTLVVVYSMFRLLKSVDFEHLPSETRRKAPMIILIGLLVSGAMTAATVRHVLPITSHGTNSP